MMNQGLKLFNRLTPLQKVLFVVAGIAANVVMVLGLIYSHAIFAWLEPVAVGWRALPGGWILVWLLTFVTAFPPMIGYSTSLTIAGFVYGCPGGWPIVATSSVAGATAAFVTSRTVFSGYVHRLVGADKRFVALGQVLRHDGVLVLAAIRLCPLPFSLSNGFLATIPSISPLSFALATALSSPKLFVHLFIGSRLAQLAENGDQMSAFDKAVNYLSMILGGLAGTVIGVVIYRRTMARAKELMREEAAENGGLVGSDGEIDYDDLDEGISERQRLRSGEADAAALMDDDDISLWETDGVSAEYSDDEAERVKTGDGVKREQR